MIRALTKYGEPELAGTRGFRRIAREFARCMAPFRLHPARALARVCFAKHGYFSPGEVLSRVPAQSGHAREPEGQEAHCRKGDRSCST